MNRNFTEYSLNILFCLTPVFCFLIIYNLYKVSAGKKSEYYKNEAEIKRMIIMHQIRPHFIFNCLNSIEVLCEKNPEKAKTAIEDLTHLLRSVMDDLGDEHKKSFEEIMEIVDSYIRLEQMRFGDEIKVEYDCRERGFSMPPLIIQPLVENAIKHGLANKKGGGTVKISSYKDGKYAIVCIEDNGIGMETEDESMPIDLDGKSHIGLSNVRERLKLICNGKMKIESEKNCGTKITIRIPFEGNI